MTKKTTTNKAVSVKPKSKPIPPKFEIKNVFGDVIYTGGETLYEAMEKAAKESANLSRANLSSADLSSANLSSANLSRANLSRANLSSADLSSANLSSANLSRANMYSANLSSANLSRANMSSAKYGDHVLAGPIFQLGNVAEWGSMLWYVEKGGGLRVICGCRHFSIDEAKSHWNGRTDRPMTRVAIAMAEIWYKSVKEAK